MHRFTGPHSLLAGHGNTGAAAGGRPMGQRARQASLLPHARRPLQPGSRPALPPVGGQAAPAEQVGWQWIAGRHGVVRHHTGPCFAGGCCRGGAATRSARLNRGCARVEWAVGVAAAAAQHGRCGTARPRQRLWRAPTKGGLVSAGQSKGHGRSHGPAGLRYGGPRPFHHTHAPSVPCFLSMRWLPLAAHQGTTSVWGRVPALMCPVVASTASRLHTAILLHPPWIKQGK